MLDQLFGISIDLTFWLQGLGGWLAPIMKFFTFLGNEEFYLLIMPILAWVVDYSLGLRIGVMLLLSSSLNETFKQIFRLPRPYWVDPRVGGVASPASGYGFPSGHSQLSLSIFGLLAAIIKKKWLTIAAVFTILMIGLSRIYLGEHFFIDVLGGFLIGGLLLWVYLKLEERVTAWLANQTDLKKIGLAFGVSLAIILIVVIIQAIPADYQVPENWLTNAHAAYPEETINPFTIKNIITSAAVLFGLAIGVVWTQANGGFAANRGAWWQRILRIIVGVIGILVLWKGLDQIFPDHADLISYIFRYLRYALVGVWISGGAIWAFIKLKLGEQKTS